MEETNQLSGWRPSFIQKYGKATSGNRRRSIVLDWFRISFSRRGKWTIGNISATSSCETYLEPCRIRSEINGNRFIFETAPKWRWNRGNLCAPGILSLCNRHLTESSESLTFCQLQIDTLDEFDWHILKENSANPRWMPSTLCTIVFVYFFWQSKKAGKSQISISGVGTFFNGFIYLSSFCTSCDESKSLTQILMKSWVVLTPIFIRHLSLGQNLEIIRASFRLKSGSRWKCITIRNGFRVWNPVIRWSLQIATRCRHIKIKPDLTPQPRHPD